MSPRQSIYACCVCGWVILSISIEIDALIRHICLSAMLGSDGMSHQALLEYVDYVRIPSCSS